MCGCSKSKCILPRPHPTPTLQFICMNRCDIKASVKETEFYCLWVCVCVCVINVLMILWLLPERVCHTANYGHFWVGSATVATATTLFKLCCAVKRWFPSNSLLCISINAYSLGQPMPCFCCCYCCCCSCCHGEAFVVRQVCATYTQVVENKSMRKNPFPHCLLITFALQFSF